MLTKSREKNSNGAPSYKMIWGIAAPIMLGSIAQTIIALTDTAFLGRISEIALGASAMAGVYYFVFSTLAWGFALGVQVIIARKFGEGNNKEIGRIFEHGLIVVISLGIFLFLMLKFFSDDFLRILINSDAVYEAALEFIDIRSYGIFFVCVNFLFRSFYIGISNTKIISYTTGTMAVTNIILNSLLIFGNLGFPAMGIKGAALASVISELSALIFFFIFTTKFFNFKEYRLFQKHKLDFSIFKTIFLIAIPTMFQKLISFGTWLCFFAFVERMGERPLASAMTVRSSYMMLGIPIYALASTTNTLVSRLIGEGKSEYVMQTVWKTVKFGSVVLIPVALFAAIAPELMLRIYTDNIELVNYSKNSIYVIIATVYSLIYGLMFFEAISGTSNTHHAMYIELFILALYVLTVWLTASYLKLSIEWVWTAEFVYGFFIGLFSMIYMYKFNWAKRNRI